MSNSEILVDGYRVTFVRRRYGSFKIAFFCWAYVWFNDDWLQCGDPYPGVHWKREELRKAVAIRITEEKVKV